MADRASVWNLVASLTAFVLFMFLLLAALGFGVGTVELTLWLLLVGVGVWLIIRRHRTAARAE
jgi:hypothetical protein